MKIDIYNHVMPVKFLEQMKELGAEDRTRPAVR